MKKRTAMSSLAEKLETASIIIGLAVVGTLLISGMMLGLACCSTRNTVDLAEKEGLKTNSLSLVQEKYLGSWGEGT